MSFDLLAAAVAAAVASAAPTPPPSAPIWPASAPPPAESTPAGSTVAAPPCCVVPKGTVITIEIAEPLSAKKSTPGDNFKLRLAEPIVINGVTAVPAGAMGMGEVIDARPPAMGGSPGKLILAARYLEVGGVHLPLQSFKLGGSGDDNTGSAVWASAIVSPLLILAVKGGDVIYPIGTRATAKVAADVTTAVEAAAPVAPDPVMPAPSPGGPADTGPSAVPILKGPTP